MNKDLQEYKRGFDEAYEEFINYLETNCPNDFTEEFNGGEFALQVIDDVDDNLEAFHILDEKVNESLQFDKLTYEMGFFAGVNLCFGALEKAYKMSGLTHANFAVEFLRDTKDLAWNRILNDGIDDLISEEVM